MNRGLVWLWVFLELSAWRGRRRRRERLALVDAGPRLSAAAARGCACSSCDRERAA